MTGLGNADDVYKHYLKVIEENKQLRQLLKKTKDILYDYKDYFQSEDVVKTMDILYKINAVINESEE